MSSATEKLTQLVSAEDRFDYSQADLRETQAEALKIFPGQIPIGEGLLPGFDGTKGRNRARRLL